MTLKPIVWLALLGVLAVLFRPTAVVIAVGLIPTWLTFLFDRTPEKFGVLCIGSLNLAGLYPVLMPLWIQGHTMERAMKALSDPTTGAVIIGAAGVGVVIYAATPRIVSLVVRHSISREIADRERRQAELVAYWGEALTEDAGRHDATVAPALKHSPVRLRR
ncbi:MAG: hypothetical protein FJX61_18105 [Alphaproteobacteria bacterium]|nr:hypothetical protein [Alphaproteobacteria bacterium]